MPGGPGRELFPPGQGLRSKIAPYPHPSLLGELSGGVQIPNTWVGASAYSRSFCLSVTPGTGTGSQMCPTRWGGWAVGQRDTGRYSDRYSSAVKEDPWFCRGNSGQSGLAVLPRCVALVSPCNSSKEILKYRRGAGEEAEGCHEGVGSRGSRRAVEGWLCISKGG